MQELIKKSWNGFEIEFELIDGQLMANATAMCAAFNEKPVAWLRQKGVQRYLAALEAKCAGSTLVETRQGGTEPGTWIHERLILKLAQWLNVDFEIQCDEWVAELLRTGKVELAALSPAEILLQQCQQLVDHEKRMKQLEAERAADQQRIGAVEQKMAEVVAKTTTSPTEFYTIAGWASLQGLSIPTSKANELGRKAAALSKKQGIEIGKVPDQRYGLVGAYHVSILRQILPPPPGTSLAMVVIPSPPRPPNLRARQTAA